MRRAKPQEHYGTSPRLIVSPPCDFDDTLNWSCRSSFWAFSYGLRDYGLVCTYAATVRHGEETAQVFQSILTTHMVCNR